MSKVKNINFDALGKLPDDIKQKLLGNIEKANLAVSNKSSDSKKLLTENKRLAKKKATLAKRKQTAKQRLVKSQTTANQAGLEKVEKELSQVSRQLDKSRAQRTTITSEIARLKIEQKKLSAYIKVLNKVDKDLAKPKKTKKARKKIVPPVIAE